MTVLRVYLWKEWREQRASVLWLLALLPALPLLAHAIGRGDLLDVPILPGVGAGAGALAALLVVGIQLIPNELSAGGIGFLERMPGSLHRAFLAKLALLLVAFVGFAVYGYLVAEAAGYLRGGDGAGFGRVDWAIVGQVVAPVVVCALWIFAVTPWVPNGPLALPTGVFLGAALCWPGRLLFESNGWYYPAYWEPAFLYTVAGGAAAVSAWASFAYGLRWSASRGRTAAIGVGTAVLAVSPIWCWSAYLEALATHVDPQDSSFRMHGAYLSKDRSEALIWSYNERGRRDRSGAFLQKASLIVSVESGAYRVEEPEAFPPSGFDYTISSTGLLTEEELSVLPAGAWVSPFALGLGHTVRVGNEPAGYFDRSRGRYFPFESVSVPRRMMTDLIMLPSAWLLLPSDQNAEWRFLDPDTGVERPAEHLRPDDRAVQMLVDGTLLVQRGTELLRLNVETGEARNVIQKGWQVEAGDRVRHAQNLGAPLSVETPSVILTDRDLGRYDPLRETVDWDPESSFRFCEYIDSSSALGIRDGRVLERMDLLTGERTVLFPK